MTRPVSRSSSSRAHTRRCNGRAMRWEHSVSTAGAKVTGRSAPLHAQATPGQEGPIRLLSTTIVCRVGVVGVRSENPQIFAGMGVLEQTSEALLTRPPSSIRASPFASGTSDVISSRTREAIAGDLNTAGGIGQVSSVSTQATRGEWHEVVPGCRVLQGRPHQSYPRTRCARTRGHRGPHLRDASGFSTSSRR